MAFNNTLETVTSSFFLLAHSKLVTTADEKNNHVQVISTITCRKPISRTLDYSSSSDISPSAPSIPSTPESSISNTTDSRNVTPTTPSKRPRSYVSETSSSSLLHKPPITESLFPHVLNKLLLILL